MSSRGRPRANDEAFSTRRAAYPANPRLEVWSEGAFAGLLARAGSYAYQYDLKARSAVSLTMPVRLEPYEHVTLHPVFQMNLPEGYLLERLRNRLAKGSSVDPMMLLVLLGGGSAIGRLRYRTEGAPAAGDHARSVDGLPGERLAEILAYRGAEGLFESLVERYLLRSGLSGVQPKVLVPERQGADASPAVKASALTSDLIIKSGLGEFPGLAVNEFICMSVAQRAGIPVPEFHLSDDRSLFVMRRFDRDAQGRPLGFEDMAVLTARDAARKYEGRYEDIARVVRAFCSPEHVAAALKQLFDIVALSCIVGNGDAHLKNFGVLYEDVEQGPVWLAPAFDIVNTTCYLPEDSLALMLGGNKSFFASRLTLLDFAATCDIPKSRVSQRILELADAAAGALTEYRELADEVPGYRSTVSGSIELFRRTFAQARR